MRPPYGVSEKFLNSQLKSTGGNLYIPPRKTPLIFGVENIFFEISDQFYIKILIRHILKKI